MADPRESKRLRILIVHPEGNLANNPNLSAIVALLAERGHDVAVAACAKPFARSPNPAIRAYLRPVVLQKVLNHLSQRPATWRLGAGIAARVAGRRTFDIAIGVDRQGLIEAAAFARRRRIPFGLISYEIFFEAECGAAFKRLERNAAKGAAFAVAPDPERAACLAAETGIPLDRIETMPVAGTDQRRGPATWARSDKLTRQLGLSRERKIMILAGSLADWTMARELVAGVGDWPGDWVLAVNERYGARPDWLARALKDQPGRLFALPGGLAAIEQLGEVLAGADLGAALYRPTYADIYTGLNLHHIGLASGKFATYLQHGLPVMVNGNGPMAVMTHEAGLGIVIEDPAQIPGRLAGLDTGPMRKACRDAFARHLDARLHIDAVERRIIEACE